MITATVICDASLCPMTGAAAFAFWMRVDGRADAIKLARPINEHLTNSADAEMIAAAAGVLIAARLGVERLLVQSDCVEVVSGIRGTARLPAKKWHQRMKRAKEAFAGPYPALSAKHVKGHTKQSQHSDARFHVNRWCDHEARKIMRQLRAIRQGKRLLPITSDYLRVSGRS